MTFAGLRLVENQTMNDINQTIDAASDREKQLQEKLGGRLLLIWLLAMVAFVELLVIVHLAK